MSRSTPALVSLLLFAVCVAPEPANARCRMQGVAPRLLMADNHVYAKDAELVVTLVTSGDQVRGFPADLRLEREGEEPITLRRRELTPDLSLYQLSRQPSAGDWTLVNGGVTMPRTLTFGTHRRNRRVAAPRLVDVQSRRVRRGRSEEFTVHAQVETPTPDTIIAGVFRANDADHARADVTAGSTDVTLFGWRRRCRRWPEELSIAPEHAGARLQYVDADGWRSGWSNTVRY